MGPEWVAEGFADIGPQAGSATPGQIKTLLNAGSGPHHPGKLPDRFRGDNWRELRVDLDPATQPDIVGSITDLDAIAAQSIDAVWASHCLEHLYRHEVPVALAEFRRVLRPGGLLLATMPDLQAAAALVAQDRLDEEIYRAPSGPITPFDILFGHAGLVAAGHVGMAHRSGFTKTSLLHLLTAAGFTNIEVERGGNVDLWATARKEDVLF